MDLFDERRPDTARFSACGTYRYNLTRELGGDRPLVICGLNPSIATAVKDDNTITKEVGFARRWQCGLLVKVNAYGFIATFPSDMKKARKAGVDVVGKENDLWLRAAVDLAELCNGIFLVGWGRNIEEDRQRQIAEIIGGIAVCLGTNKDGTPTHPLYVPY